MIKFEISDAYLEDELENYITEITGRILDEDEWDENHIERGVIKATHVDLANAYNDKKSIEDIFDDHSAELSDVYGEFFLESGKGYQHLDKCDNGSFFWEDSSKHENILFIDEVVIDANFKGKKIGLAAIYRLIQKFAGSCKIVVLKVFPLQFKKDFTHELNLKLNEYQKNKKAATEKLKNHYKKIGFFEIPDSDYMYLPCEYKTPSLKDIGFSDLWVYNNN